MLPKQTEVHKLWISQPRPGLFSLSNSGPPEPWFPHPYSGNAISSQAHLTGSHETTEGDAFSDLDSVPPATLRRGLTLPLWGYQKGLGWTATAPQGAQQERRQRTQPLPTTTPTVKTSQAWSHAGQNPGPPLGSASSQLQLPWRGHQNLVGKHRPLHQLRPWPPPEGPQPGLHIGQPAETPALLPLRFFLGSCHLHFRNPRLPCLQVQVLCESSSGSPGSALPHPAQPPRPPAIPSSPFYIPSWRPAACPQLPPARASAQISAPGGSLPRQPPGQAGCSSCLPHGADPPCSFCPSPPPDGQICVCFLSLQCSPGLGDQEVRVLRDHTWAKG